MDEHWFLADVSYWVETVGNDGKDVIRERHHHHTKHTIKAPSKHRAELNLREYYAKHKPEVSKLAVVIYEAIF